ncbi:MAG TPA: GNAT family N-acetyltransferase [Candidatus Bathyarchaeia archaeon]|nr:GNAT family N-acetyltransferase [Candidatus Bathyarchaeia archaeon]
MSVAPKENRLVVKPVENNDELRDAVDMIAKTFAIDYFAATRWIESRGAGYPGHRREHTRIALWNGEPAGALRINSETIRIGEARLKTGGLGWVTTLPRHRNKGIATALVQDALDYMVRHNYHVSMLFGIPNFYHRFTFTTTLAEHNAVIETGEALAADKKGLRMRQAKPGDIPAIQKIHAGGDTATACSLLRSSAHITSQWEHWKGARVLTNGQGRVVGYFHGAREGDCYVVKEAGLGDTSVAGDVLYACARLAGDEALGQIRFHVPPTHALARVLLQYKSIHEMHILGIPYGMMAFVNLGEALESLIPEWENLLEQSALRDVRVEATLLVDKNAYRIRANKGAIDVAQAAGANKVTLSASNLMHLATGYRHPEDVLDEKRRMLTSEARALIETIFPKRNPYVWLLDRF